MRITLAFLIIVIISSFSFSKKCCFCFAESVRKHAQDYIQDSSYTFVKFYSVDGKGGEREKIEYTCVLSKSTSYKIDIRTRFHRYDELDSHGILATIYDSNRKKVVSNVKEGLSAASLNFNCKATGIYYLTFSFTDNCDVHCAGAVLSYKR